MCGYYARKLSAEWLRLCYEIAPPRVKRYLDAEIVFVLERMRSGVLALELGCGYGRVLERLAPHAGTVVGIDTSRASLRLAQETLESLPSCRLVEMDAVRLAFPDRLFDTVLCIQNGISAFRVDQRELLKEALRVTRSGGTVLFSSYSARFWQARLEWFAIQSEYGLIGEIDYAATGDGVIVCRDGFRASTTGPDDFRSLAASLSVGPVVTEVDESSVFCEIRVE
jgi:2-polyprenyl-6-hydroxyphenyl methylase/3-demethylubiquinone-9 3-methyltransferase